MPRFAETLPGRKFMLGGIESLYLHFLHSIPVHTSDCALDLIRTTGTRLNSRRFRT